MGEIALGLSNYNVCEKTRGGARNCKKRQKTAKKNVFFWIFGKSTNGMTNLILKHHHKCGGTSFNPYIMLKTHFIQNLEGGARKSLFSLFTTFLLYLHR